jgi:hypothetical protein
MRGKILDNNKINKLKLLRSKGKSLPEISKEAGIPKTTVYRYIRNVRILPEYLQLWYGKRGGSRKRRDRKLIEAKKYGEKIVGNLSEKEKALIFSSLYWAEGGKGDFNFTNTDADMIKIFVEILQDIFKVDLSRLRINLRLYEDLDEEKCKKYWSGIIGISKDKILNINRIPGKKKGKLKWGMCRVRILKGGDLLKQVNGIIHAMANEISP